MGKIQLPQAQEIQLRGGPEHRATEMPTAALPSPLRYTHSSGWPESGRQAIREPVPPKQRGVGKKSLGDRASSSTPRHRWRISSEAFKKYTHPLPKGGLGPVSAKIFVGIIQSEQSGWSHPSGMRCIRDLIGFKYQLCFEVE